MGWWIAGGVCLLIAALLCLSVAADVRYDGEFTISAGICGWRYPIFPIPEKPEEETEHPPEKKKRAVSRSRAKPRKKTPPPKSQPEKGDLKGTVGVVLDLLQAAFPPLAGLVGKIRLTRLDAVILVGGEDAAGIALEYGKICALVSGGLAALQNMLRVKVRRLKVSCDFLLPETRQEIAFCLKLRLAAILWAVLRIGWRFLAHTIRKELGGTAPPAPQSKKN